MSLRRLDNNWIKTSAITYTDPHEQNIVLRVISNLKSGVDLFNKSSITGQFRRPSQQKPTCHKLPQLTKRNTTEISVVVNQGPQIQLNNTIQSLTAYGRISVLKQDNPQSTLKKRLKTSQAKRSFGISRYNWNRETYGQIEMKGVVFKKKKL